MADAVQMEEWVEIGKVDAGALEVLWHAGECARLGYDADACPFGDGHAAARQRWRRMYAIAFHAEESRMAKVLAPGLAAKDGAAPTPPGRPWWQKGDMA